MDMLACLVPNSALSFSSIPPSTFFPNSRLSLVQSSSFGFADDMPIPQNESHSLASNRGALPVLSRVFFRLVFCWNLARHNAVMTSTFLSRQLLLSFGSILFPRCLNTRGWTRCCLADPDLSSQCPNFSKFDASIL